jgi:hypothetical protein
MTTSQHSFQLSLEDITNLDKNIELLYEQKPIAENEVKILCEKVSFLT